MHLYPPPKQLTLTDGRLRLSGRAWVQLNPSLGHRIAKAASRLAQIRPGIGVSYGQGLASQCLLNVQPKSGLGPEGYQLVITNTGAKLRYAEEAGAFRGLTTFAQILKQAAQRSGSIACLKIVDQPDFDHRGIMLDISRCKVPTLETLKGLIDQLAQLKFNQLQLYTEHTFAFANHAQVWQHASPLTTADLLEIQQYCQDRFIDLVPNLNSFGHFERWLRHPTYQPLAECPDGFVHPLTGQRSPWGSTLKPNRASLSFLEGLYNEYLPLFQDARFNIGGDEPWELGHGASRARCMRQGTTAVYVDFLAKIQTLARKFDRQPMFWSDIVLKDPSCLKTLSREATALIWGYEHDHPFETECEHLAKARLPFYVCPGTASWNAIAGRLGNATTNLKSAASAGLKFGAEGYLVTDWGDHGHHQYLPLSYPGFLLGGCNSWNQRGSAALNLADGLNRIFFDNQASSTVRALIQLGHLSERVPTQLRNATVFNRALFWNMKHEPSVLAAITDAELQVWLDALTALPLQMTPSKAPGLELVQRELRQAAALCQHGLEKLQLKRLATAGILSPAKQRIRFNRLKQSQSSLIDEHQALWLSRNRLGGLKESVAHLAVRLPAARPNH